LQDICLAVAGQVQQVAAALMAAATGKGTGPGAVASMEAVQQQGLQAMQQAAQTVLVQNATVAVKQ
jgi:hypothetical protein